MTLRGLTAKRIVTCDPARATDDSPLGALEDAAILYDDDGIRWIGPRAEAKGDAELVDYGDRVVTPGLVDAHTHAAWVGSRHQEYVMRMAGADYRAIAEAGGGILSTYRAVAEATEDAIVGELAARLRRMAELGVTTVEVKSGYGLDPEGELKQLHAIARARSDSSLPNIVATFLGLHALPLTARASPASRAAYVERASGELLRDVVSGKLADFVDAYVDGNAFTVDEARLLCGGAKAAGLGVRLHVGQFADIGGAQLCAELGAKSADHLEHVDADGIEALASAGVAATLLPVASFTLGQEAPPIHAFREAGVTMVVASDANPGTAPTESLPLAMALAVPLYGLTPTEAILGATRHAALALGLFGPNVPRPRGALVLNAHADFVVWDLPHEHALLQPWASAKTHVVLRDARRIAGAAIEI